MTSDRQYFASKVFIKFLSKIFYRFTITGTEHLKDLKAPYIIAANHHSTIDAIIMGLFIPPPYRIHFLGKESALWNNRAWSAVNDFFGTIPVKKNSNTDAIEKGIKVLTDKRILGIFPEGKRSPDGRIQKGKTGAVRIALDGRVPIVPVGIKGGFELMPQGKKFPKIKKNIILNIGKPFYFDKFYKKKITKRLLRKLTDNIMDEIAKLSNQRIK